MSRCPSVPRGLGLLAVMLVAMLGAPAAVRGQDAADVPVQVEVAAVGTDGVAGIALLSRADAGTAVQVLVVGAPAGTTAIVHPGDCTAPDPTLVALIGDVGAAGQVQTTVPVAFETLTDGGHVIAFHPGLDMATLVGCGTIPVVAAPVGPGPVDAPATAAPAPPTLAPIATVPPPATPATPAPAVPDPACAGVADWIAATEARLTRVGEALSELNTVAGRYDLNGYLSGLASFEGELQFMAARQSEDPVPVPASDLNATTITTYTTYADAARQIYDSLTVSVDVSSYSRAMTRYDEATKLLGDVRRTIGELKGRCG